MNKKTQPGKIKWKSIFLLLFLQQIYICIYASCLGNTFFGNTFLFALLCFFYENEKKRNKLIFFLWQREREKNGRIITNKWHAINFVIIANLEYWYNPQKKQTKNPPLSHYTNNFVYITFDYTWKFILIEPFGYGRRLDFQFQGSGGFRVIFRQIKNNFYSLPLP